MDTFAMLKVLATAMSGPWAPAFCPPTCLPTKMLVGNVRQGVSKPDVLAFCRGMNIAGIMDLQIVHRANADSSVILAFLFGWQAQHAIVALRAAGEWCPIRSESGLLKVRFKEGLPSQVGRYLSKSSY